MEIDRNSDAIARVAHQYPCIVLTGARQAGKTTLARRLFPKHTYVSLDLPSLAELAEQAPAEFLARFPPPVLIDEVQYAPGIFRHLKTAIDTDRHAMGRFVLTGSQRFTLMQAVSDSLAGRAVIVELETLAWDELTRAVGPLSDIAETERVLVRGGFPELWREPSMDLEPFYSSYLATYLERDVRQLLNVTSLRDFERFIRACAARNGQLLDKSAIASDIGVSAKAVSAWLTVLEASHQIAILEPWFTNVGKRLVKTPKLYFRDTGLLCFLLGITAESLATSPFVGAIWETAVFAELRKRMQRTFDRRSLWFYRDAHGHEVDFLLAGSNAALIECKWTDVPSTSDIKPMRELMGLVHEHRSAELSDVRGYLLCRAPHPHPLGQNITGINLDEMAKLFPYEGAIAD